MRRLGLALPLLLVCTAFAQQDLKEQALQAARDEDWERAAALIREALRADAQDARAYAIAADIELRRGRFREAEKFADAGLKISPDYEWLQDKRAEALMARAREAQRERGYGAALALLEPHLAHPWILYRYASICVWDGQEERATRALRASRMPAEVLARTEADLLATQMRWREAADLLREAGLPDPYGYKEAADLRDRLAGRGRRALWLALGAGVVLMGGWLVAMRFLARGQPSQAATACGHGAMGSE